MISYKVKNLVELFNSKNHDQLLLKIANMINKLNKEEIDNVALVIRLEKIVEDIPLLQNT
jgi:hypothetical protein